MAAAQEAVEKRNQALADAQALYQVTRSPLEQYNAELARYNELLQNGRISRDLHDRAIPAGADRFDELQAQLWEPAARLGRGPHRAHRGATPQLPPTSRARRNTGTAALAATAVGAGGDNGDGCVRYSNRRS